jgi:membrane protein
MRSAARHLWRALMRFFDHNGPDRAAAIAYYTLLSLLPLLLFLISFGALVIGSFDTAYRGALYLFRGMMVHMDDEMLAGLRQLVERANRFQAPGILLLAWTSRRAFSALLSALERVFDAPARSFARGNLFSFAMVLLTGLALLATLAMTMLLATFEGVVQSIAGPVAVLAIQDIAGFLITRVIPSVIAFSFFFVVYRFFPRRQSSLTALDAALGALLATLLWEIAKAAFAYYIRNLTHYAGLYGALEGIIVLALWLELSASIILLCGEVVALRVVSTPAADTATS